MGQTHDGPADDRAKKARAVLFIGPMTMRDIEVAAVLRKRDFDIATAEDVRCGFEAGRDRQFDLIVIGYVVSATPALPDLIASVRETFRCPVICVGPHASAEQIADLAAGHTLGPNPRRRRRNRNL